MRTGIATIRIRRKAVAGEPLSPQQLRVLTLASDGYSCEESGKELGVLTATVKNYRTTLLDKMGADNMPQAVAMAFRRGILK